MFLDKDAPLRNRIGTIIPILISEKGIALRSLIRYTTIAIPRNTIKKPS
jgi:hypothetical protein